MVAVLLPTRAAGEEPPPTQRGLVASDPSTLRVVALTERAGRSEATVLLVGETGVGKELFARRIHDLSPRGGGPFIAVNCGSITETLAESLLFGHEKGAFTGANARKEGFFEAASGGTLFLDEIGEMPLGLQTRLLRVLEEHAVTRVGGTESIPVDVRIVAATHRDLEQMVTAGTFRRDLLYRLDVVRIEIPPLRKRQGDIEPLVERFVGELAPGGHVSISADAMDALRAWSWPGNVRELRNVIERSLALRDKDVLRPGDLQGLTELSADRCPAVCARSSTTPNAWRSSKPSKRVTATGRGPPSASASLDAPSSTSSRSTA